MKFRDLKLGDRFKFQGDLKIWTKSANSCAERNLEERYIFWFTEVELVDDNEIEDTETIERNSLWQQRLGKS